jgi:hypothetical protein
MVRLGALRVAGTDPPHGERQKDAEPAGSNKRLNHIFDQLCKDVLGHPKGVEAAMDAIAQAIPRGPPAPRACRPSGLFLPSSRRKCDVWQH